MPNSDGFIPDPEFSKVPAPKRWELDLGTTNHQCPQNDDGRKRVLRFFDCFGLPE
jgi:hypothetical protein